MADKFVVIEYPNISKRKENILAIINQDPQYVHASKSSLIAIHDATKSINDSRKDKSFPYSIRFKLYIDSDKTLYEDECNRIITEKEGAKEFDTIDDFAKWYTEEYSKVVLKEKQIDDEVKQYIVENRKRPHK